MTFDKASAVDDFDIIPTDGVVVHARIPDRRNQVI
jgi:hypothetical protein